MWTTRVRTVLLGVLVSQLCAPAAHAQTLAPGWFDPTGPSSHYKSLLHTKLRGPNAMQSFAFDERARQLYVLQTVEGAGPRRNGDMWLNRIDYSGRLLDHMRLNGFGHGATMGLTRAGNVVWLWVESASSPSGKGEGFGTRVARVTYMAGRTVEPASGGVTDVTPPQTVGRSPRPTIDPVSGNLVIRYDVRSGVWGFLAIPTTDALARRWGSMRFLGATPSAGAARSGERPATSQGYAFAGSFAYLYYGDSYQHVRKPGNAHLRAVPLEPSRTVVGRVGYSYSLADLAFREPEGIAVQVNGGRPRLVFGFAEDPVTRPDELRRLANFSYKQTWATVPPPAPPPPPVATPAPPAGVLVVHPRRIVRARLLRVHRIAVSVGGVDGRARIRVSALLRGRRSTLYSAPRRVGVARRTLSLRLSRASVARLRRASARRRVTVTVTVTLGKSVERVRARVARH